MADSVVLSWGDGTHAVTIQSTAVKYLISRTFTVNVAVPETTNIVTGTVTSLVANKLICTTITFPVGLNFLTAGVRAGMTVKNTFTGTYTTVLTVDSATQLTLNDNIFPVGGTLDGFEVWFNEDRLLMDTKNITRSFQITGYLSGSTSTNDFITLEGLVGNTASALKLVWRELTFTDVWIERVSFDDTLSLYGTTKTSGSQTFPNTQVLDDTATFPVTILLSRGRKYGV